MSSIVAVFLEPTLHQRGVGIVGGLILIIVTLLLLHKFHMKEEYGLLWIIGGVILIASSIYLPIMKVFTLLIGAGTPTTTFFCGSIFFLLLQNLRLSIAVSNQKKQIQTLAIELSLKKIEPTENTPDS